MWGTQPLPEPSAGRKREETPQPLSPPSPRSSTGACHRPNPTRRQKAKGPRPKQATSGIEQGMEGQRCMWGTREAIRDPVGQRIPNTQGIYAPRPRTTGLVHDCKTPPAHQLTAVFRILLSPLAQPWCVQRGSQGALPAPGPQEREMVKEGFS